MFIARTASCICMAILGIAQRQEEGPAIEREGTYIATRAFLAVRQFLQCSKAHNRIS